MSAAYENIEDIKRMQQEAIKRVREMQKRAKISLEYGSSGINGSNEQSNNELMTNETNSEQIINANQAEKLSEKNPNFQKNNMFPNAFNSFIKDPEKGLILVLILLLSDENADIGLILALMYIML